MTWETLRSRWAARLAAGVLVASVVGLGTATSAAYGQQSPAIKPPPVPANIQVPPGNEVFLVGHGVGTQNYVCLPSGDGFRFTLFTPQATLFSGDKQLTTHFFSPNPSEGGTIRVTWQHSRDSSTVWAKLLQSSTDPNFVAPGAVAWVLLETAGVQAGPGGGDTLTATTFVQRLNTAGGLAPATGCASATDVGHQAFVPYTADYFFYKSPGNKGRDSDAHDAN